MSATNPYRHYRLARASEVASARQDHDPAERVVVLSYGAQYADLAPFVRTLQPGREDSAPFAIAVERTSATNLDDLPPVDDYAAYDELANLEHELDQRMVGEFTLLDILKKGAERADWSKRSARNLMNTLERCAADLIPQITSVDADSRRDGRNFGSG